MLAFEEALARVLAQARPLASEIVALEGACGRVLARDCSARLSMPRHRLSAMDGYAIRSGDLKELPCELEVTAEVFAGLGPEKSLGSGQAQRIFTGGIMPEGADTVAMQEICRRLSDRRIRIDKNITAGTHVREAGLDFTKGQVLLKKGWKLTPRHLALLASMNHVSVPLFRRPRMAILSSGDELRWPGENLGDQAVPACNAFGLKALAENLGAKAEVLPLARDNMEDLAALIDGASSFDLLVTSGGASVGEKDLIVPVLEKLGWEAGFWKVAVRPGKPLIFGRRGHQLIMGLPGNPVSSLLTAYLFLWPLLEGLQGLPPKGLERKKGRLLVPLEKNTQRRAFLRALVRGEDKAGQPQIWLENAQDSARLRQFADADVLVERAPNESAKARGEEVDIRPLPDRY